MALVEKNAAILVKDSEARKQLIPEALNLLNNKEKQKQIAKSLKQLEKPNATIEIVDVCESIVERKRRRKNKVKSEE
jgi:UDP-N-acetylglucosamine--N-acetylmuramyl-(pentapeptide) pyrophosphoryl-undecaprenol N-acetylglucosamine transferase